MKPFSLALLLTISFTLLLNQYVFAHCDTYSGPVVSAARKALETQNVRYVLVWVKKDDEDEIEKAFRQALTVRKLGPEAKELADKSFFETVVRLHRAGEGAPYTGLKQADYKIDPIIPLADQAIEKSSLTSLDSLLRKEVHEALHAYFKKILQTQKYDANDVHKGREFVAAYVKFIHFVEEISAIAHSEHNAHHQESATEHSH